MMMIDGFDDDDDVGDYHHDKNNDDNGDNNDEDENGEDNNDANGTFLRNSLCCRTVLTNLARWLSNKSN